jgi:hypothetical protein
MNFVTFGNETINLDNVTHITVDKMYKDDGTYLPFIRFNFVGDEAAVTFFMLTWDNKPMLAYHEAKEWLEHFQEKK